MYKIHLHKDAQKVLRKSPSRIREKVYLCLVDFKNNGVGKSSYQIKPMSGQFKRFKYLEVKISKDYRLIFRIDGKNIYVRYAGTHNSLGTG